MGPSHPPFRFTKSRRLVRGIRRRIAATAGTLALAAGLVAMGPQASAAGLTQVTGFGTNPGSLSMYAYAPDTLAPGPLVIALHGCTQSASDYYAHSGWPKFADRYGFALVLPRRAAPTTPTPASTGSSRGTVRAVGARPCRSGRWSTRPSRSTAATADRSTSRACPPVAA